MANLKQNAYVILENRTIGPNAGRWTAPGRRGAVAIRVESGSPVVAGDLWSATTRDTVTKHEADEEIPAWTVTQRRVTVVVPWHSPSESLTEEETERVLAAVRESVGEFVVV